MKTGTQTRPGPGCRKSPLYFFDSLHNASLFCLLRSPKSCRCAVQTPAACVCRHSIQHEGSPAPSYSPCETERFFSKQRFFDKLSGGREYSRPPLLFARVVEERRRFTVRTAICHSPRNGACKNQHNTEGSISEIFVLSKGYQQRLDPQKSMAMRLASSSSSSVTCLSTTR